MEAARIQMMGEGFVIANIFGNFIRQSEYPGEVQIHRYVGAIGRSSYDLYHELRRTDNDSTVYANGGETMVWLDFPNQKSLPIPQKLREWLKGD